MIMTKIRDKSDLARVGARRRPRPAGFR